LTPNTIHEKEFKLRQRALHVVQESLRVLKFSEIANASEEDEEDAVEQLSEILRKSHESLKTLYECSHPNLDKLVEISDDYGVGARLTGAGWGGCIVALAGSITECDRYITTLKECYYDKIHHSKHLDLDEVVFATEPQSGAEIFIAEFS